MWPFKKKKGAYTIYSEIYLKKVKKKSEETILAFNQLLVRTAIAKFNSMTKHPCQLCVFTIQMRATTTSAYRTKELEELPIKNCYACSGVGTVPIPASELMGEENNVSHSI